MQRIGADYAGGDPDAIAYIGLGGFLVEDGGRIGFVSMEHKRSQAASLMSSQGNQGEEELIALEADEVLTVLAGDQNHMRMLTRVAVGEAIGGGWGGIIGAATGKRNHGLVVVCRRGDFEFTVNFVVTPDDARRFLDTLAKERRDQGLGPLPTAEDALGVSDPQQGGGDSSEVLGEIKDLLIEQNALLRQLVERSGA